MAEASTSKSAAERSPHSGSPAVSGSCTCMAITWTSTALPTSASYCYCRTCRKISGSPFIAFMDFPVSSVTFSSRPKHMSASPNAVRGFCAECGSTMTMAYRAEPENIGITLGSMDEESSAKDVFKDVKFKHIYTKDVPSWYQMPEDGLERWETMRFEKTLLQYG